MDFSSVCRTCLSTDSLYPIFKDDDDHDRCSSAVYMVTGAQVHINDNMPQNMCSKCVNLINTTLKFRKQCKIVETELLRIKSELKLTLDLDSKDNLILIHSRGEEDTKLSNDINCLPKINIDNVLNIKQEEVNETLLPTLKTAAIERNIKIRNKSIADAENDHPYSFYIDYEMYMSDNETQTDEMETKNTQQYNSNRKSIKKVNIRKKSKRKTGNSTPDTFYNDNERIVNDCGMRTDAEQLKMSRKEAGIRNISLNETEQGISISFYEINNDMDIKTADTIKRKRRCNKKVDSKYLNDNTVYTPHKVDKNSNTGTVESEKSLELPYNVLPDVKDDKVMRVVCKMCAKELSIRSIDSHMTRCHPGADARKVKCELCDKHLLREKLNRHMSMIHGSSYRCGYCKSEFDSQPLLVEHVKKCTAKNKKRKASESGRKMTECDECHQKLQKASLRMHKATKHAGLRPVCEHCGKAFGNKLRLNEHYRAKHGYEKLKCSYCEFASASVVALRNHERRHRGEKPFVCEACGAKFHAAYLLAQHRHSHRTEKTVKCDLCPATFKANNSLHVHKLTCHSKCVYKCGLCARAYRCRHYALKHVRHVHAHAGPAPPLLRVTSDVT